MRRRGKVFRRKLPNGNLAKTWTVVVDVDHDEGAKRRQKWVGGFPTKTAAQQELNRLLTAMDAGDDPLPAKKSAVEYGDEWLDRQEKRIGAKAKPLSARTVERYRQLWNGDLRDPLKGLEVRAVKPGHIRRILEAMADRGLSARTITQGRVVLSSMFRAAVEDGLIAVNPVTAIKAPTVEQRQRPSYLIPKRHQLDALARAAEGTVWKLPMLLSAYLGVRRSECLAIQWGDVDLKTGRVKIQRSVQRVPIESDGAGPKNEVRFLPLKTVKAYRTITLPLWVAPILKAHRQEQLQRRLAAGDRWQDFDLVCDNGRGGPLYPDAFTRAFKGLAVTAGLPAETHLHDVRHGWATFHREMKTHPVVLSAMLGHASVTFTQSVYQHAWEEDSDQAAGVWDRPEWMQQ